MKQNVFEFQKEPLLTLKDTRIFGYQNTQLEQFFVGTTNKDGEFLDEACEDNHLIMV